MAITAIIAANNARESARRTEECKIYVQGFDSKISSTAEQKYYATCVQLLNPEPVSETEIIVGKFCVASLLISFVIGLIVGWREEKSIPTALLVATMFPLALVCIGAVVIFILMGIAFLFK